jgi:exonuclease SbcC
MKITLKNFRCHRDIVYELPDIGLSLLSGISGAGKSSLIKAIFYVLYGKIKKPFSFGTTSCSVELVYRDHIVYRSSRPNILTIKNTDQKFQDEVAQSYINQWIGLTREEFEIAGYIAQKNGSCVLSLSPLEQIQTIQTLSFEDSECLKERLKGLLKESSKKVTKLDTQLSFAKSELESLEKPNITDFPENLESLLENTETLLSSLPQEIEDNNVELESLTLDMAEIKNNIENSEKLNADKKEIKKQLKEKKKHREEIRESIKPVESSAIDYLKNSINYLQTKQEYDEKLESETQNINNRREEILTKLWSLEKKENKNTKLENYRYAKKVYKEIGGRNLQQLEEELELLQNEEETYKNVIENAETLICPICDGGLKIHAGVLITVNKVCKNNISKEKLNTFKNQLKETTNKISKIISDIETLSSLDDSYSLEKLKSLEFDWETNQNYEAELKKLNSGYSKDLEKLERKLNKLNPYEDDKKLEYLISKLKTIEDNQVVYKHHVSELKRIEADIMNLTRKLETLNSQLNSLDSSKLENIQSVYGILKIKNTKLKEQQKKYMKDKKRYENLIKEMEKYKRYSKWETRVAEYSREYESVSSHHNGLLRIKERYRQAEILAVESTLESINQHTQYYLDQFFKENPLYARLEIVQNENSTKKMEIRTVINYKGYEYDSITQLSGGEFDRCVLASVCGVNTMMNCPVMFLDESLSSLDTENNTEILNFLKELSETKLIAVCSHEAIQGIFDHTVEI